MISFGIKYTTYANGAFAEAGIIHAAFPTRESISGFMTGALASHRQDDGTYVIEKGSERTVFEIGEEE